MNLQFSGKASEGLVPLLGFDIENLRKEVGKKHRLEIIAIYV